MKYDPNIHHRRSIRLQGKDYTDTGAYFVTIVTCGRDEIFGEIKNGEMLCNGLGNIAREQWFKTAQLRPNVVLYEDEFIAMPNHIHGILWIVDNPVVRAERRSALEPRDMNLLGLKVNLALLGNNHSGMISSTRAEQRSAPTTRMVAPGSLGAIVRGYKAAVTYRINTLRDARGATVWQRNYYEHIIRNEADYKNIWHYIQSNPQRWEDDQLHPSAPPNRYNDGQE